VQESLEHLKKALEHVDKARKPLAEREKTFNNRILVRIVDFAGLHLSSALMMLSESKEETCEKS